MRSGRGVGVEFAQPTAVSASTRGRSFQSFGRQEERALVGLVRVRAITFDRSALDFVGGAGVLFQHHELRFAPCFSGCAETRREMLTNRAPALAVGAEMPVRITRHFSLTGVARYYAFRRGEHVTDCRTWSHGNTSGNPRHALHLVWLDVPSGNFRPGIGPPNPACSRRAEKSERRG
jgi:hypothetical protein